MQLTGFFAGCKDMFGRSGRVSGMVSGRRRLSSDFADFADELQRSSVEDVLELLQAPPEPCKSGSQAPLVLVNAMREPVPESLLQAPGVVLLHVYDLNEGLSTANTALSFASDMVTLGGAFHAAVEVYGGEWTYGSYGVSCIPPRSEEVHVYKCSIYMGRTDLSREQLAPALLELAEQWSGASYDLLGRNCCSFATEVCKCLGVGEVPHWVDRFARFLHSGREAGVSVLRAARRATSATARLVREAARELPAVSLQPCGAEEEFVRKVRSDEGPRRQARLGLLGGA